MRAKLVALAIAYAASAAHADSYRVVLDRADLEPSELGGYRLRVTLSAVAVGGQLLDIDDPRTLHPMTGSSEIKAPFAFGHYAQLGADTAIVLVVEASAPYGDVLPIIADSLGTDLLGGIEHAQIAVMPYGDSVANGKLGTLKAARGRVAGLASDGSSDEPAMLDAVERALMLLRKAKLDSGKPLRKIVVVIGDGRDRSGDRDRVTKLGKKAGADGVRIHTIGFSPTDQRRPLLALGELSKRSLGTFRWVRGARADSWSPAIQQLRDEITKEIVLTYFVDDASMAGKKLELATTGRIETRSQNQIKIGQPGCGGEACDGYCAGTRCVIPQEAESGGVLSWILMIAGGIAALLAILVVIGWRLSKRAARPPAPAPARPATIPPPQLAQTVASQPPPVAADVRGPMLYIMTGPRATQRVLLKHGFTIGKAPTCDLVIDDGYTSGVHAQISMDQFGNCRLYDNNSTNGVYVNGIRVAEYALQHGVSMRIGSTELRFLAE